MPKDAFPTSNRWLSTVEAANDIGVSDWWIRERIESGLLPAILLTTGRRRYRIAVADWERFKKRYVGRATDPRFDRRR